MIEKTLIRYLSDNLDTYVGMEPPEQTAGYVLIDKLGSSWNNHITTSRIAVQSYGDSLYKAMELNEEVRGVMDGLISLDQITSVVLETDYNFTNTATKQYRWQAVYNITHY